MGSVVEWTEKKKSVSLKNENGNDLYLAAERKNWKKKKRENLWD